MTQSVGSAFFGVRIPFLDLLGARPGHREKGRAVISLELREKLTNSWGFAHGGVVMTLLDVAMGSAVRSTVPAGLGVVTVNLGVTFLHSAAGSLTAEPAEAAEAAARRAPEMIAFISVNRPASRPGPRRKTAPAPRSRRNPAA